MPRTSDADQRLMEAALGLIWQNSYGSTSVDDICQKADVRKGSFYHFFASKSVLAVATLEGSWQATRTLLDAVFSASRPPLERIDAYLDHVVERQCAVHGACGSVLGCPIFSLGSEVCTLDPEIRAKVQEILGKYVCYFETAIRDAQAAGAARPGSARQKAALLFALVQGTLTQARILNDVSGLRELKAAAQEMLCGSPSFAEKVDDRSN